MAPDEKAQTCQNPSRMLLQDVPLADNEAKEVCVKKQQYCRSKLLCLEGVPLYIGSKAVTNKNRDCSGDSQPKTLLLGLEHNKDPRCKERVIKPASLPTIDLYTDSLFVCLYEPNTDGRLTMNHSHQIHHQLSQDYLNFVKYETSEQQAHYNESCSHSAAA